MNGTNQYVEVPSNGTLNPTTSVSLEAWIYPRLPFVSEAPPIIKKAGEGLGQQDGYALELSGSGAVVFGVYVSGGKGWCLVTSSPLPPNQWAHVAGIYDGTSLNLYVNGAVAVSPVPAAGQIIPSGNNLQIGHDPSNPPRFFNGIIDEPTVYNGALSPSQVQAIYYASSAGKCQATKAPIILAQPRSQTVAIGSDVSLSVEVSGSRPLSYQWSFNGTNLQGASGSSLQLTNAQLFDSGSYAVVVTNAYGAVVSSDALLTVSTFPCATIQSGAVSWWAAEASAADWLGGNNGVLKNGASFAGGKVGMAFDLNGSSQYVDVPNKANLNPATAITVEAWVYPRPPYNSVSSPVIKKAGEGSAQQDGYALELYNTGAAVFGVYLTGGLGWVLTPQVPVPANQWSHVAGVYDGTKVSIYLNGVLAGTPSSASGQIVASGNSLQIGHDPSNASRYFNGLIDEATVYNTALSASQIQTIFSAGTVGKCPPSLSPTLLTQPQDQTVATGANVSFAVAAMGATPLAYQWQFYATNLAGATNPSVTLANVQPAQSGPYAVIITNFYGAVTSAAACLAVLETPQIVTQPQDQVVVVGTNVTFAVVATGSLPRWYQWFFEGTPLSLETNATLVLNSVSSSQGGRYRVAVSNAVGSATSRDASLIVLGAGLCMAPPAGIVSWWPGEKDAFDSSGLSWDSAKRRAVCPWQGGLGL